MKYSWELSAFDTEILGFKTAKITRADHQNIHELRSDLLKHHVAYATYRIAANDYPMIQSLEENGFILVDGFITLETHLASNQENSFTFIKEAIREDYPRLIDLAGNIFRDVSRYYHDPIISIEKADNTYKQWMKNSLAGKVADMVLVWKEEKDVLGFITLQKKGQIPLIGVSEKARGKGVGKGLTRAALATFKKWGLKKVFIETQMTNVAALHLYHSCGFAIISSHLTFRWHSSSI